MPLQVLCYLIEVEEMNTEDSTVDKIPSDVTTLDLTTKTAALFDPTWQLAITIEFYFQYVIIAIGVFGTAANALVLYALIQYHLREAKKRAINLLMINQNLLDLSSCILLLITFSVKVGNIYLTGALGYFLCTILVSENAAYCTLYASIINLTTASPNSSCSLLVLPSRIRPHARLVLSMKFIVASIYINHQPNDRDRRALPEGGPSLLEQEEPEAMDDIPGNGVCLDLRHSVRRADGVRLDDSGRRDLLSIFRLGQPSHQADHQRLDPDFILRCSGDRVRVLLRSYRDRDAPTDPRDGRPQRGRLCPGERLTDPVRTNQVEHSQDDDRLPCWLIITFLERND